MIKKKKLIPEIAPNYEYIFGYLEEQKPFSAGMFDFVIQSYSNILKRQKSFSWLIDNLAFPSTGKTKYIFVGRKYLDILEGLPRDEIMVLGYVRDWWYCLWRGIPFKSGLPMVRCVVENIANEKLEIECRLDSILPKDGVGRYLILYNDSLPVERMYCLLARRNGMKSLCIQHGVFTAASPSRVYDGGIADLMLVYDQHQRELLIEGGVPIESIGILGFHSNTNIQKLHKYGKERRICVLGQPWGAYYPKIGEAYLDLLNKIFSLLDREELNYSFKPHPNEKGERYIETFANVEYASLQECFEKYDVFISFTSTALIEATLAGRVAIQVFDQEFLADRFEDYGYSYSVESVDLEKLVEIARTAAPLALGFDEHVSNRFIQAINHFEKPIIKTNWIGDICQ